MISYSSLFKNHRERRLSKWVHYFDIYDRYFSHLIGQKFTLIEIGVDKGGSLQLWKKYFGNNVSIVGIDINPNSFFEENQIKVFVGDQTNLVFLNDVLSKIDQPLVIIDDGSHIQSHILKTLEFLFPRLSNNGIYMIEDCHTSYWPRFEGGLNSHLNVVDILSRNVHDVNFKWYNQPRLPKFKNLNSISFHDSIVVLEKIVVDKRYMIDVDSGGVKIMDEA